MSTLRDFRIIDGHAHVASMHFVPADFIAGVAANMAVGGHAGGAFAPSAGQIQAIMESQYVDHEADDMVRGMNAAGVERTVLLVPDFTNALKCPMSISEMARRHHAIRLRHPDRFYVFQGIDPRSIDALQFFRSTIANYGFDGLKLYPPCGYSPSSEKLFPFYEICRDFGLPVLLHTGPTSPVLGFEWAKPSLVDVAARLFPEVTFILAHGGVNNTEEAALLCAYRPNVYLDIAGFPTALQPHGWREHLRGLFRLGINHKIIFGTDWPLSGITMSIKDCVDALLEPDGPMAGLPPREIAAIMGGTIERLILQNRRIASRPRKMGNVA